MTASPTEKAPVAPAIRPNPGPQTEFLSHPADIVIYGGAAGSGKSWALLLEPLRSIQVPGFGAVIFRRTSPQITNKGSLWDKSHELYPQLGGVPRQTDFLWRFPWGSDIRFSHLEHENTVYNHQGSEIPLIEWDELTHFEESQFWYMLSRNRSVLGSPGYMRATTNPDADSWVAKVIDWWLAEDGYPDPARAGRIRYFARVNDALVWADHPDQLVANGVTRVAIKSLSFVPASIYDNPVLMAADPTYIANLRALPYVEQMRLLGGNWKIRAEAGMVFNRDWFKVVDQVPTG